MIVALLILLAFAVSGYLFMKWCWDNNVEDLLIMSCTNCGERIYVWWIDSPEEAYGDPFWWSHLDEGNCDEPEPGLC